jgi:uncharacterized protein
MKTFQLLVKPVAADCNSRCTYCFYRRTEAIYPEPARRRMSLEIAERMIREFLELRQPETVFSWQGGEPTLAGLDFYKEAVRLEQSCGRSGQVVGNALQTNGLRIGRDWAEFLAEYQFLVGLSLDGPAEIHNTYRRDAGGRGNFDQVMAAVEALRGAGAAFNILAVVSKANVERPAEVYRFFRRHGFHYLQFVPCLERDASGQGLAPFSITPEAYGRFLCVLWDLWIKDGFPEVSIRDFDSYLARRLQGKANLCTFQSACGQYLVIEHNGDVYPCDFYVQPDLKLGRLGDRPLAEFLRLEKARAFARAKNPRAPECGRCPWRSHCHGGCQKDRLLPNGSPAACSRFCPAYQAFFAHAEKNLARLRRL